MDIVEPLVPRRRFVAPMTHTRSLDSAAGKKMTHTRSLDSAPGESMAHTRSLDFPPGEIMTHKRSLDSAHRGSNLTLGLYKMKHVRSLQNNGDPVVIDDPLQSSKDGVTLSKELHESSRFGSNWRSVSFLKEVSLFQECRSLFLYALVAKLQGETIYPAGHVFYKEGDPGTAMFIIGHGDVNIIETRIEGEACVAILTTGCVFGEIEALSVSQERIRRSATAQAKTLCDCRFIERDTFSELLSHYDVEKRIIETEMVCRLQSAPPTIAAPPTTAISETHEIQKAIESTIHKFQRSWPQEIESILDSDLKDTCRWESSSTRSPSKVSTDSRPSSRNTIEQCTKFYQQRSSLHPNDLPAHHRSPSRNSSMHSTSSQTAKATTSQIPLEKLSTESRSSSRNPSKQGTKPHQQKSRLHPSMLPANSRASSDNPSMQSVDSPTVQMTTSRLENFQRGIRKRTSEGEQPDQFTPVLGG